MNESNSETASGFAAWQVHGWTALRKMPWSKLGLEMFTVVTGVVLGMQVANWNDERRERAEVRRLLSQLKPELEFSIRSAEEASEYYAVTRAYAQTAFKGWGRDPTVSDQAFIIAAYQASQVIGTGINDGSWAAIFGGEQLRRIDDVALRRALVRFVTTSTESFNVEAVDTPYRGRIRQAIPEEIQTLVRTKCGDQPTAHMYTLPSRCDIALPEATVASTAAKLRSQLSLVDDLNWHLSETANYIINTNDYRAQLEDLYRRIGASE